MQYNYSIDDSDFEVSLDPEEYEAGPPETLSEKFGDLTREKEWFSEGFGLEHASQFLDMGELFDATERAVRRIISDLDKSVDLSNFTLEKYHHVVDQSLHHDVIKKTRRLFPSDLDVDVDEVLAKFSEYFGKPLTFVNPLSGTPQWMIARINTPRSNNFNTAHKDCYQAFDQYSAVPKMVNIWIPLSGVTERNSLPIAPRSHLLPEDKILRTTAGSTINGVRYSVNSIMSWDGSSALQRPAFRDEEILLFSSHLIHGLAFNAEEDTTRISFEFRLYEDANG